MSLVDFFGENSFSELRRNVLAIMTQKHKIGYNPNIEVKEEWVTGTRYYWDEQIKYNNLVKMVIMRFKAAYTLFVKKVLIFHCKKFEL
ncbi:1163_t:CDS:2 [Gigaspora rosea]|nr:1163_t:CDS:2 [Gigaspora rosea]